MNQRPFLLNYNFILLCRACMYYRLQAISMSVVVIGCLISWEIDDFYKVQEHAELWPYSEFL